MVLAALMIMLPLAACSEGSNVPLLQPIDANNGYRLGAGDNVHVAVVGAEDLTGDYQVGDNGNIAMPLIGDVRAQGLTRAEVEHVMVQKLSRGYIKNPQVSVNILSYRPFYIYGEVTKPGEYPYESGMSMMSAVATAGGYTYRANESYVLLTRHGHKWRARLMMPIRPDDIVKVPERYF